MCHHAVCMKVTDEFLTLWVVNSLENVQVNLAIFANILLHLNFISIEMKYRYV